jgi:acetyl/propionyl-CoA carboxylase alpha subunit
LSLYHKPEGDFIRVDDAMSKPYQVSSFFDPMIAKLITHGKTREEARYHMLDALLNYGIHGIKTNISYLHAIMQHADFIRNTISTRFFGEHTHALLGNIETERGKVPVLLPLAVALISKPFDFNKNALPVKDQNSIWKTIGYWRILMQPELLLDGKSYTCLLGNIRANEISIEIGGKKTLVRFEDSTDKNQLAIQLDGEPYTVFVSHPEAGKVLVSYNTFIFEVVRHDVLPAPTDFIPAALALGESGSNITSPMPGKVIKLAVKAGDEVAKGDLLLVVEAMKMENNIHSPANAKVERVNVAAGDMVDSNATLIHLSAIL